MAPGCKRKSNKNNQIHLLPKETLFITFVSRLENKDILTDHSLPKDENKDILDDQSRPAGTRSFSFFPLQVPGNDYLSFLRFILPPLIVFHCLPTIITIISLCPFSKLKNK